jgi:hypothetical protein
MALNYLKSSVGKVNTQKTTQAQLEAVRRYKLKNKLKISDYNKNYYETIHKEIKREKYRTSKLFNELPLTTISVS